MKDIIHRRQILCTSRYAYTSQKTRRIAKISTIHKVSAVTSFAVERCHRDYSTLKLVSTSAGSTDGTARTRTCTFSIIINTRSSRCNIHGDHSFLLCDSILDNRLGQIIRLIIVK